MIDFNTEPYNDDYLDSSKFYKILFRPSYAVQARELTQLQTILQAQIQRHGDHVFKQGAMVIPGQMSIDTNFAYVKLTSLNSSATVTEAFVNSLKGRTIVGSTSGVTALVLEVANATETDKTTLYVKYTSSGNSEAKTFSLSEELGTQAVDGLLDYYCTVASEVDSVGVGSAASIQKGVYYINGYFVLCDTQTLLLDKYSNTPSYRIGLNVVESIVTPEEDETLLDNAQNSYNYAAPGAHRHFIDLVLSKRSLTDTNDADFIELARIENGQIKRQVRSTDYAILEQTMARRTYDESGNYTVTPFEIDVREDRNNNRGIWTSNTSYLTGDVVTVSGVTYVAKTSGNAGTVAPSHTSGTATLGSVTWEYNQFPYYNRGINLDGDEGYLSIGLEPGKAYVQGYEIEKIATEYVKIPKGRDFAQADNAVISSTMGNYVLVTNLYNLPKIDSFDTLNIYNRVTGTALGDIPLDDSSQPLTAIGTARVRGIEWHSGTLNSSSAVYKLFLFDVKLNNGYDFNTDVKSFYGTTNTSSTHFTADIQPISKPLVGSVSQSTFSVTGNGTSFETDLQVGDYVYIDTTLSRVATITSQQAMTVDNSATHTNVTLSLVSTEVNEPENSSLVFPLPYYAVKSARSALGTNDVSYSAYYKQTGTSVSNVLTLNTDHGVYGSTADSTNYLFVNNVTGLVVSPTNITKSGSTVSVNLGSSYGNVSTTAISVVDKSLSDSTEKIKTFNTATLTLTTQATATAPILKLGKADCFRIVSVKMKSGSFASPGSTYSIDISDRYEFDDGQRDTHYDIGSLTLKASFAPPSAPIEIVFEYFTHDNGDYFSVNSYSAIPYSDIPSYRGYSLRDCLDFRPRVNDSGSFDAVTTASSLMPKRGSDVRLDFSYYLSRTDKIGIDFNGKFFSISGVSSLNPGEPEDAKLSMTLYKLELEPYTFGTSTNNVKITKVDNRRYTMRDIGTLEKRINNLEYYTSLSLLEQETASLSIRDSESLDRFKNGFIVDNFSGHNVGDVGSPDYLCSIDMENGELRPFFSMQNINVIEKNTTDAQRASSNYKMYGDVITLPLDAITPHVPLVKQEYASRTEFVNPYAIFTFLGDVRLTPSSDDWFEVDRRPDIIRNDEGNFNIISMLAEKAGVLGTVWNAWQTQWTGVGVGGKRTTYEARGDAAWPKAEKGAVQLSVAEANRKFGKKTGREATIRRIVVETVATKVGQARTGTKTSLVAKIDTRLVEDRTLSVAMIPYIRSRNILVQTKKLKPNTKFYAFFDDVPISEYCTPASKITYTLNAGSVPFMDETNVGGLASEVTRRIDGDSQSCLTRGDVITGVSSGATAVIVGKEYNPNASGDKYSLFVSNVVGTFTTNETITGSVSGAIGTMKSATIKTKGSDLTTNFAGELNMLFNIPNTDSVRFRTGTREFKLVDTQVATDNSFTSRGRVNYTASGVLETKQATIASTRNAQLVEEQLTENQVIVQSSERVVSDTGWYDPLAQTFLVQSTGGAFLSKVDLFFANKDANVPVSIEIREVVNGYPGKRILPFSKVTKNAADVNLSTNVVMVDDVEYPSFDVATTFEFPSPVYVQNNNEYALVIQSDSNAYKVWISQMGDQIPGSSRTISEQPYAGVLFKSQNASTWTADQSQDLKFTIYRAKFTKNVLSNLEFVNDVLPLDTLEIDPFETKSGSSLVRVWHENHGMTAGDRVVLSNSVTTSVNGITYANLYGSKVISNVDLDSYTITAGANATMSGYGGGATVKATKNIQYDVLQPQVQAQSFSDTSIKYKIKTLSGKSVDGNQSANVMSTEFSEILANENNTFYSPRMIASETNETLNNGGAKSLEFSIEMNTTNDALSPMIDTHRTSMIAISNKINAPTESQTNVSPLDTNTLYTGLNFNFLGYEIKSTNTAVKALMSTVVVGTYITIAGATTAGNNGTYLVTSVTDGSITVVRPTATAFATENSVAGTSISTRALFFDEITPIGSSSVSKYVSKTINLATPSTFLRVRLAGNIPAEADVLVYYKTSSAGSVSDFSTTNWVLMSPDSSVPKIEFGDSTFYDIDYSKDNLVPFDAVAVKLVMKSTNSATIPRIKDLRIIACA